MQFEQWLAINYPSLEKVAAAGLKAIAQEYARHMIRLYVNNHISPASVDSFLHAYNH